MTARCICDFATQCDGGGVLRCLGCGGDQCVCAACYSQGGAPCEGCEYCWEADGLDVGWPDEDDA